jgi:hypothetical protein
MRKKQPDSAGVDVEPVYSDAPEVEVSYEELEEILAEQVEDTMTGNPIDTQHTDGSTDDPYVAQDQGLVYTPPSDPPVLPSDDWQGAEIAAGFATSMEESDPDVEDLPDRVDNQDSDLAEDVATSLRYNSETSHLHHIRILVRNGIVRLRGTVFSNEDLAIVEEQVRDLAGVIDVQNELEVAGTA